MKFFAFIENHRFSNASCWGCWKNRWFFRVPSKN